MSTPNDEHGHLDRSDAPPASVFGWGEDAWGPFVELTLGEASQRLRWIPPGRFLMGSPEDEPGRDDDEGPQHEVTISEGFWLFDTPCTQRLWAAVMGGYPSYFVDPLRPVEQVSWEECQRFIERVATEHGVELSLPTEAEWEYACRAGTTSATYAGPMDIVGINNAPILDKIAWYGGNSGVEYDHGNGVGATDWPEKQYAFGTCGTRQVAMREPNRWGIYDTLGNVLEWCRDGRRRYTNDPVSDPAGAEGATVARCLRGGSWLLGAREVRAACRRWNPQGSRNLHIGFRCRLRRPPRGMPKVRTEADADGRFTLDVSELPLGDVEVPAWAASVGRDRYGPWAELEVRSTIELQDDHVHRALSKRGVVTQRLRWIPPGRFLMGSPADEPGRVGDEGPQHEVTISEGFWLFGTPCTQALWESVMGENPSRFVDPLRPVENVNWEDCHRFIKRMAADYGVRLSLPTEAQWEYACRAGTTGAYGGTGDVDEMGWYDGNSHETTHRVGGRSPNRWGLYDMHGNVWEWCEDVWHDSYEGAPGDGRAWTTGSNEHWRVLRGGSWGSVPRYLRSASRNGYWPGLRCNLDGFRVAAGT